MTAPIMATNMNKPAIAGTKYVSARDCGCVVATGVAVDPALTVI